MSLIECKEGTVDDCTLDLENEEETKNKKDEEEDDESKKKNMSLHSKVTWLEAELARLRQRTSLHWQTLHVSAKELTDVEHTIRKPDANTSSETHKHWEAWCPCYTMSRSLCDVSDCMVCSKLVRVCDEQASLTLVRLAAKQLGALHIKGNAPRTKEALERFLSRTEYRCFGLAKSIRIK